MPSSLTGCYTVSLGKWNAARISADPPPSIVLLDSIGVSLLEKGKPLARPYPLSAVFMFDMGWWIRPAPEHLEVVFTDGGFTGVRLHLVWGWGDATWRGTIEAFADVEPAVQASTTVSLAPKGCDQGANGQRQSVRPGVVHKA